MGNKNTIHPLTNIEDAINAINAEEVMPVSDFGSFIVVFNTSNWELGDVITTEFDATTGEAIRSASARPSKAHTVQQTVQNPIPRKYFEAVIDDIPKDMIEAKSNPKIMPGCC